MGLTGTDVAAPVAAHAPQPGVSYFRMDGSLAFRDATAAGIFGSRGMSGDAFARLFTDEACATLARRTVARGEVYGGRTMLHTLQGPREHVLVVDAADDGTHTGTLLRVQTAAVSRVPATPPGAAALQSRLRFFASTLAAPAFYVDCAWRVRFANRASRAWLGTGPIDPAGRPLDELADGAVDRRFGGYLRLALQGQSVSFEREFAWTDRSAHWAGVRVIPDVEPDGSTVGVLVVLHDITEERRAPQRVAERERELRLIMEHVPTPIAYVTDAQVYTYINLATETWLNRPRGAIEGRRVDEVVPLQYQPHVHACLERTRAGENAFYERTFVWDDGSEHYARVSFAPDHDAQGRFRGTFIVLTDLTEHKQIEEALAAREKHFRVITDLLPAPIVYVDRQLRYGFVNRQFPQWMGRTREEIEGRPVAEVLPPEALAFILPYLHKALSGEQSMYERDFTWADGSVHHATVTFVPDRGDHDQVVGMFAVLHDLTDIRQAEAALAASEKHFRLIADELAAPVIYVDQDEVFRFVNRVHPQWLGKSSQAEVLDRRADDVLPPEAYRFVRPYLRKALAGERAEYERRYVWPDGTEHWGRSCFVPDIDEAGRVRGALGVLHDLTDVRRAEQALARAHQVLSSHVENSPLAVIEWDPALRIQRWAGQAARMFGIDADGAIGHRVPDIVPTTPEDRADLEAMLQALSRGAARRVQTTVRHAPPGGQTLVCEWYSTAVIDETGAPISILSLVLDVSQRAALEAQLRAQATHDTLTGLANRRLFDDRLGLAVAKARRSGHTVGLLFIDLDGFKDVNDRLGHDAGDRLLVETSRRFAACMREGDTLARLGGDEFVIILDPLDQPGNAALVARKLLDALAAPFELGRSSARVSASMGIALFPEDAADAAMLVKCADAAMYESKRAGKNRWVYFAPEHEASAALRP